MICRQLATTGGTTVAMQMSSFRNFTAVPHSSYQANVDNGYAIVHGTSVVLDTTGVTVLEPRVNLHDACVYLAGFEAERGVVYVLVCADGHKLQFRLKSVEEEIATLRALKNFYRNQETRRAEPY